MTVVGIACLAGGLPTASGGAARFWISESKTDPGLPDAPTIDAAIGRQRTLYIWAQPATDGDFRELENFSLDIVTLNTSRQPEPAPFIDFIDGTYQVENPSVPLDPVAQQRFQYTADSFRAEGQGGPLTSEFVAQDILDFDVPDTLRGLQGVSPFENPPTVGIGHTSDPLRVGNGSDSAWLVGEFSFQTLEPSGTTTNHLFLQIGYHGMGHVGDGTGSPVLSTQVKFGDSGSPEYSASNTAHRQTTLATDTFDLRIIAVPAVPGDFNGDGAIGPEDYGAWESGFGQPVTTPGDGADGNFNGVVDTADYVAWRKFLNVGGAAMPADKLAFHSEPYSVPEPHTILLGSIFVLLSLLAARRQVHS
jgi:hypothetical protein